MGAVGSKPAVSSFSPADVAGLVAWYDAADTATITDAGSGAVSAWADKSSSGFNLSQGTAAARPTTGINTQNGRNVLTFDGGDVLSGLAAISTSNATAFVAGVEASEVSNAGLFALYPSTGSDFQSDNAYVLTTSGTGNLFDGNASQYNSAAAFAGAGVMTAAAYAFRKSGDNWSVWRNLTAGGSAIASGPTSYGNSTGILIGGRFLSGAISGAARLNGRIFEVIAYSTALSTSDREDVTNYLTAKWGL